MKFTTWEPVYEQILAEFDFDRRDDERARDRLVELTEATAVNTNQFAGQCVAVAGAGQHLESETTLLDQADAIVAASEAGVRLAERGYEVSICVTDLDGAPDKISTLAAENTLLAVHAHGDNIDAINEWIPKLPADQLLPTTQAAPVSHAHNFGGFTDGDRAAFLADALGATELVFPGWSFDDPTVTDMKKKKLDWAARLLHWLEIRRNTQFSVLNTCRDFLELPVGIQDTVSQ